MSGRVFRLPVQAGDASPELNADGFEVVDSRWSVRDRAHFYYLRSPAQSGDYDLSVRAGESESTVTIQVRSLRDMRQPFEFNGAWWPRRWPLGQSWHSTKTRQTLQDTAPSAVDEKAMRWWASQDDTALWRQLPPSEFARAHYVNVHQGCPHCGTAIFARHGGFYPWKHDHLPYDLKSECPNCESVFPSNDLAAGDFSSGDLVDDGFGYFDDEGHVYLFAAVCHRDLVSQYTSPIQALTAHLRSARDFDAAIARQLGLMLLRWSAEEIYVAAAPQFRHGPSQEVEKAWDWGQPDWASEEDPIAALHRKGSLRYAVDIPGVGDALALAYDTIWPFVRSDDELVDRARAQGLELDGAEDAADLIEECLASLMQCSIDGAGLSNKPRISEGVLTALRCLDRPDAGDVMEWLYDRGPDRLRVFATNNFTPDGVPPEASGGYNNTHTRGLFDLEYQLRELRRLWPDAYPLSLFPSQMADPRVARILLAPYENAMLGKLPFHFGDGGSAGVQGKLGDDVFLDPLDRQTLDRAAEYLGGHAAKIRDRAAKREHRRLGATVQDGVGIAILRTGECPERAAAGIVYGDAPWHRHMDLLDVQLYAFDRPFLSDLGYPQSWANVENWEGNWATHNSVWAVVPEVSPLELPFDTPWHYLKALAGRGRLVRTLFADGGVQVVEVEARRWAFDADRLCWFDPGVTFRRLLALVETDDDGVALIDLARISGGSEHWRICRGLEGTFDVDGVTPSPRTGTLAGPHVDRGNQEALDHPDHGGLAWMDDVAALGDAAAWRGAWSFSREPGVSLDLHQLNTTPGTEALSARATAVMGAPEESKYGYRPVAWKRCPTAGSSAATTCIDLVFEPRTGEATVARAEAVAAVDGDATASGVLLETRGGRQISVYWAPQAGSPASTTRFADGTVICGSLAVIEGARALGAGASRLDHGGRTLTFPHPRQQGTIAALDRGECIIEVEGIARVAPGDRIAVNPTGRGHTYRVEEVTELGAGSCRLRLDVTSVLGRARVSAAQGVILQLDFFIITRTGNLHQTRLEREADGAWQTIEEAVNADAYSTQLHLDRPLSPDGAAGEWVAAVDYVVGDPVLLEAVNRGAETP